MMNNPIASPLQACTLCGSATVLPLCVACGEKVSRPARTKRLGIFPRWTTTRSTPWH